MLLRILRSFTKIYPFLHPRGSILNRLPDVPNDFGTFKARNGIKYAAFPSGQDYIVKNLFWFGEFEPWVTSIIARLIEPGEIVCDIGANIGDSALQIISYLGSFGHIYCFEPVPMLHECLKENLKANNIPNITLVPKALSNFSGKLNMIVLKNQPGGSKIINYDSDNNSEDENIEVEVTTFDEWLDQKSITNIAVCKIDVECHELEVIEGMKNSLKEGKVGSIVFERFTQHIDSDVVTNLLSDYNFKIYRIYKSFHKILVLEQFSNKKYFRGTFDHVAVLKGSIYEKRLENLILKKMS